VEGVGAQLGRVVEPIPVLFAGLLKHWGHVGPAEIEPKRRWAFKRALQRADELGVQLVPPPHHPFNPLRALRVTVAAPALQRWSVVHALFEAAWSNGRGVEHETDIRAALRGLEVDVDQLLATAALDSTKEELRASTARAIQRGVFGIPTPSLKGWRSAPAAWTRASIRWAPPGPGQLQGGRNVPGALSSPR
jgi:2-hydroxychromene-2-carboxylate isomerase